MDAFLQMKFYVEPQGIEWVKKVVLWIRPLLGVQSSLLAAPLTPPFHVNMFTVFFSRLFPWTQTTATTLCFLYQDELWTPIQDPTQ